MTAFGTLGSVSGEIMTGPAGPRDTASHPDILDAEFETLPSPARMRHAAVPALAVTPQAGIGILNAAPPASKQTGRGGPVFWTAGSLAVATAFWVSGGHALFGVDRLAAATAQSGARIERIASRIETVHGTRRLLIEGEIVNTTNAAAPLGAIVIHVLDRDSRTVSYRLGLGSRDLAPGNRQGFSSRVDVPAAGVQTVSVSLENQGEG